MLDLTFLMHLLEREFCHFLSILGTCLPRKGFGLRASTHIPERKLVAEYVGEIIPQSAIKNWRYSMSLPQGFAIDASMAGGKARFINHSCKPNCSAQRWLLEGRWHVGIFTIRGVQPLEELTFSYSNGRSRGNDPCHCGSVPCTGYIARPPRSYKSSADVERESMSSGRERLHQGSGLSEVEDSVEDVEGMCQEGTTNTVDHLIQVEDVEDEKVVEILELDETDDEQEDVPLMALVTPVKTQGEDEGSITLQDLLPKNSLESQKSQCFQSEKMRESATKENCQSYCNAFFAGDKSWHQAPLKAKQLMEEQALPKEREQMAALSLGLYLPSALCLSRGQENSK